VIVKISGFYFICPKKSLMKWP